MVPFGSFMTSKRKYAEIDDSDENTTLPRYSGRGFSAYNIREIVYRNIKIYFLVGVAHVTIGELECGRAHTIDFLQYLSWPIR